ncbi:hypothetical protein SMQC21_12300 [Serratia marcescens]|nr:hypothetical protein SMQC21_12300 [Serratia marcescens]
MSIHKLKLIQVNHFHQMRNQIHHLTYRRNLQPQNLNRLPH